MPKKKQADHLTFLKINSEYPKSLKTSISYSQALRLRQFARKQ